MQTQNLLLLLMMIDDDDDDDDVLENSHAYSVNEHCLAAAFIVCWIFELLAQLICTRTQYM